MLEEGKLIAFDPPKKVFFQAERMRQALVNIPEAADLDHKMRAWAVAHGNGFRLSGDEACVTVGEVKDALQDGLKTGKIRPTPAFTRGLGRHVPESNDGQSQETVLEVQDVSYAYSKKAAPAIQNISLSLRQGEVVAMIGQNGAGKTTLMKCITGVFKPTQGSVKINKVDVTRLNALERAKQVGLILQNPDNQLFRMSAEEEVAFGLTNQGLSKAEIKRITDEVLQLTGMEKFRHVYPFRLSLGDRRKLAVASIYAMHPSILIFDEPTTGQDFQGRYQLCDLAMRLNRMGTTIIMITHDMSLVAKYTQRTLVMGKGTILLDAPTREVFHRDVLSSTFLEPPPVVRLAQELKEYGVPQEVLTVEELYNTLTGETIEATI